jgi:hypothetical protein
VSRMPLVNLIVVLFSICASEVALGAEIVMQVVTERTWQGRHTRSLTFRILMPCSDLILQVPSRLLGFDSPVIR